MNFEMVRAFFFGSFDGSLMVMPSSFGTRFSAPIYTCLSFLNQEPRSLWSLVMLYVMSVIFFSRDLASSIRTWPTAISRVALTEDLSGSGICLKSSVGGLSSERFCNDWRHPFLAAPNQGLRPDVHGISG